RARPLPKSVIGHSLDDKGRKRGARDRQQDRRPGRPERQIADARERAEIEHTHDVAERLRHGFGGVGRLAIEHALLEEDIEKEAADAGQNLDDRGRHAGNERHASPFDIRAHGGGRASTRNDITPSGRKTTSWSGTKAPTHRPEKERAAPPTYQRKMGHRTYPRHCKTRQPLANSWMIEKRIIPGATSK